MKYLRDVRCDLHTAIASKVLSEFFIPYIYYIVSNTIATYLRVSLEWRTSPGMFQSSQCHGPTAGRRPTADVLGSPDADADLTS